MVRAGLITTLFFSKSAASVQNPSTVARERFQPLSVKQGERLENSAVSGRSSGHCRSSYELASLNGYQPLDDSSGAETLSFGDVEVRCLHFFERTSCHRALRQPLRQELDCLLEENSGLAELRM
jgi:hypothetical protein